MDVETVFEECGLSRAQLARDSGLSEATFHSWITGKRTPSKDSLKLLAEGLRRRARDLERLAHGLERRAR